MLFYFRKKSNGITGEKDGAKGTLTFTEKGFTRTTKYASDPNSQTVKGTWLLDASKKIAADAVDCIVFKDETGSEVPEDVMPTKNNILKLIQAPTSIRTYKRK